MNKQIQVAIAAALIIVIFVVSVVIYNNQKEAELNDAADRNSSLLIRDYSPATGNQNAKVTIVEFFDPACETCRAFYPFVKKMMDDNPGKIRLVLRYLPLHHGSDGVVKLLEAARLQDKFWETLKVIYESQPLWASHHNPQPDKLWDALKGSGLDFSRASADMLNQDIGQRIQQDLADARMLGVTKTPGFFVNGKPLIQFGYKQLQQLVESEISDRY